MKPLILASSILALFLFQFIALPAAITGDMRGIISSPPAATGKVRYSLELSHTIIYGSSPLDYAKCGFGGKVVAGSSPALIDATGFNATVVSGAYSLLGCGIVAKKPLILFTHGGKLYVSEYNRLGEPHTMGGYVPSSYAVSPDALLVAGLKIGSGKPYVSSLRPDLSVAELTVYQTTFTPIIVNPVYVPDAKKPYIVMATNEPLLYLLDMDGNGLSVNLTGLIGQPTFVATTGFSSNIIVAASDGRSLIILDDDVRHGRVRAWTIEPGIAEYKSVSSVTVEGGHVYVAGYTRRGSGYIIDAYYPFSNPLLYLLDGFVPKGLDRWSGGLRIYGMAVEKDIRLIGPYPAPYFIHAPVASETSIAVDRTGMDLAASRINVVRTTIRVNRTVDRNDPAVIDLHMVLVNRVMATFRERGLQPLSRFTDQAWMIIDNTSRINISVANGTAVINGLGQGRHLIEAFYIDKDTGRETLFYYGTLDYPGGLFFLSLYRNTPYIDSPSINGSTLTFAIVNPSNMSWRGTVNVSLSGVNYSAELSFNTPDHPSRMEKSFHLPPGKGTVRINVFLSLGGGRILSDAETLSYSYVGPTIPPPTTRRSTPTSTGGSTSMKSHGGSSTSSVERGGGGSWTLWLIVIIVLAAGIGGYIVLRKR